MSTEESGHHISEELTVHMEDSQPEAAASVSMAATAAPDASPVQKAAAATVETTGADPPPAGS